MGSEDSEDDVVSRRASTRINRSSLRTLECDNKTMPEPSDEDASRGASSVLYKAINDSLVRQYTIACLYGDLLGARVNLLI